MQDYINFSDVDLPQEYIKMGCEEVSKLNKDVLSGLPKLDYNQNIFVQGILEFYSSNWITKSQRGNEIKIECST